MKLGIVIALWQRPKLTALTLRRFERLCAGDSDVICVAATDEADNAAAAARHGFRVVSAANKPLSRKLNTTVASLRGEVDAILHFGSDDWLVGLDGVSPLETYRKRLAKVPFFGVQDLWYADLVTRRARYVAGQRRPHRRNEPMGPGRALRADLLEALRWTPWSPEQDEIDRLLRGAKRPGLDGLMKRHIVAAGWDPFVCHSQRALSLRLLDIKSQDSLTPFRRVQPRKVPWDKALAPFPPDEVAALEELIG